MIVKCLYCQRIRVGEAFRLPWPGELKGGDEVAEVYCPRCAREMLGRIQAGEFAVENVSARKLGAVNS
ncbi:MAG: hypothetical protein LBU64_00300 [Planctomycetota bacterium]|nr:hypothetical protein [Planctomycetota bacterium]